MSVKKLFLTSVAALLLTGAAHAGQRAHAIVGQPRIITRIIQTGLLPPPKYDKPYDGELEIWFFSNPADVQQACNISGGDTGCTKLSDDHKHCWMFLATEDLTKRKGRNYAFVLRHELAHCNGWTHPKTTEGRHFDLGETWDKAEGGKWIAADTKMPMPKLPASTRILPASPPTICVTPDWKQESCKDRSIPGPSDRQPVKWPDPPPLRTFLGAERGGRLDQHVERWKALAASGDHVEIRDFCPSACTLVLAYIPKDRLCFSETAVLAFHHAMFPNAEVAMEASSMMFNSYPHDIRMWLVEKGGLKKMPGHNEGYWLLLPSQLWQMGYRKCEPCPGTQHHGPCPKT